jgi:Copper transport outer membrane protein, MctB
VIDFRYHLVSIIAVFLALAIGLAVGSTALSGKAVEFLNSQERRAVANNATLTKRNQALTNQIAADQAFAQAASQRLLQGLLAHEKVVLVVAPGADNSVTNGVAATLRQAGATVTGQVYLSQSFLTTTGAIETNLTQLAQNLAAKTGLAPPAQSQSQFAGQQATAELLAASLLDGPAGTSALSGRATVDIMTGLEQEGFVSASATPAPANLAVLVTPGGPPPQSGGDVLVAVATELKQVSDGIVMAGASESVGSGSVIDSENSSPNPVSTVDNADTESGQVMVAQALRFLLDGKAPTAYGINSGNAPSPAPSPSPSPTTTTAGGHP